jgi:hypothetical protein
MVSHLHPSCILVRQGQLRDSAKEQKRTQVDPYRIWEKETFRSLLFELGCIMAECWSECGGGGGADVWRWRRRRRLEVATAVGSGGGGGVWRCCLRDGIWR